MIQENLNGLLDNNTIQKLNELISEIDSLYDVDKVWNKGFGDWKFEYKYRRGGKTLCSFYVKKDVSNILITYGKMERDKFETIRETLSESIQNIYDETESLHDGKWLWIPIDGRLQITDIISMLKIKRRPNKL